MACSYGRAKNRTRSRPNRRRRTRPGTAEDYFIDFLRENAGNIKAEYFIPLLVNHLITNGIATVKVLDTTSHWFGVTYAEDRPSVVAKIRALVDAGEYPEKLF